MTFGKDQWATTVGLMSLPEYSGNPSAHHQILPTMVNYYLGSFQCFAVNFDVCPVWCIWRSVVLCVPTIQVTVELSGYTLIGPHKDLGTRKMPQLAKCLLHKWDTVSSIPTACIKEQNVTCACNPNAGRQR